MPPAPRTPRACRPRAASPAAPAPALARARRALARILAPALALALLAGCSLLGVGAQPQAEPLASAPPYATSPDFSTNPFWDGTSGGDYGTGLALADINGDKYPDLIVASGNDKALQQVQVYYNDGHGKFPTTPDWHSTDTVDGLYGEHNALVAVGDIDGDGYNDVAVSIFLGPRNEYAKGGAKVYFNRGGTLETTASWRVTGFPSFGLDLADANGDGLLDLAVACGEPIPSEEVWATQPCDSAASAARKHRPAPGAAALGATANPDPPYEVQNRIYYNTGKGLSTTPGWVSADAFVAMGCIFADVNADGLMDIVFDSAPVRAYLGRNDGSIDTSPGWTSNDVNYYGNGIDFARTLHNAASARPDDVPTLATSSSNYIGNGRGGFSLYRFLDPYIIQYAPRTSWPDWQSDQGGWGSAIHLVDLNQDGNLDILTHRWNDPGRNDLNGTLLYFQGNDATASTSPDWTTTATSVIESIQTADLDIGELAVGQDSFVIDSAYIARYWKPGQDHMRVLYVQQQHPVTVYAVAVNGAALPKGGYRTVPGRNWVAFTQPILAGDTVQISYLYSSLPDLVYTNWNCDKGTYIYYNRGR